MKTIEELAQEYADSSDAGAHPYNRLAIVDAYIAGAKNQREELARWYDPKKTKPHNLQRVLVKYKNAGGGMGVAIATYHRPLCTGNGVFAFEAPPSQNIVGWRPIHE